MTKFCMLWSEMILVVFIYPLLNVVNLLLGNVQYLLSFYYNHCILPWHVFP